MPKNRQLKILLIDDSGSSLNALSNVISEQPDVLGVTYLAHTKATTLTDVQSLDFDLLIISSQVKAKLILEAPSVRVGVDTEETALIPDDIYLDFVSVAEFPARLPLYLRFATAYQVQKSKLAQCIEQGIKTQTSDLQERNKALLKAKENAESASLAKSRFLADMSHELRTPLNAIIGYSEILIEDLQEDCRDEGNQPENDPVIQDLHKISSAGKHLLGLINSVLDLSKIEAGKMDLYYEDFDTNEMLQAVLGTAAPLIEKNQNTLVTRFADGLGRMNADLTKIRQILINLMGNASKFTEKGTITLEVYSEDRENKPWVVFKVIDSGIGMTSEQLKKLFQPFTQADASTTKKYGGTGLGLTISKRFAEMMHGDISVSSVAGEGSTFTLHLPMVRPKREAPKKAAEEVTQINSNSGILVIDDDPMVGELVGGHLRKLGYHVETAGSGLEGLELATRNKPAAIILDIMMPDMDGWTVLSRLKAAPHLHDVPVIIMSMEEDRSRGYSLGATEYLVKPVERSVLTQVLDKYQPHGKGLVMVVEDDPGTRNMMRNILRKTGWDVSLADNGQSALNQLEEKKPDLILLDLMMPVMDGFEFVRRLHEHPTCRSVPVVVLTAKDLNEEERKALHTSVQTIFQKGAYSQSELLEQMGQLLAEAIP